MLTRDVDALARLLDGDGPEDGAAAEEARSLAALASALQPRQPEAPPTFKADLRTRLLDLEPGPPSPVAALRLRVDETTARWRYSMRMAAASAAAAMALSTGGVAVAAGHALPGDLLYPVKLTIEDIRLLFLGQSERASRHLTYAETRVAEARHRALEEAHQPAARALRESDSSTRQGAQVYLALFTEHGEEDGLHELATFSVNQRERLNALTPLLSGESTAAAADSIIVLDRIDARLSVLLDGCAVCGEDGRPAQGAEDFDYTYIPPADEEFDPCPCVRPEPDAEESPAPVVPDVVDRVLDEGEERRREVEERTDQDPPADEPPADEPPQDPDSDRDIVRDLVEEGLERLPVDPPVDPPAPPDDPPLPPDDPPLPPDNPLD